MAQIYLESNKDFPTVTNLPDIINMVKACLVTGYGKRTSAGWALLYDSNSNPSDLNRRIILQSKSPASEQMVYELVVKSGDVYLNAYTGFDTLTNTGTGQWRMGICNNNDLGVANRVIADEKFCWFSIGGIYACFGDFDSYNTAYPQSIAFSSQQNVDDGKDTLPSTIHPTNHPIIDNVGINYLCRSYLANEWQGYGANKGYTTQMNYQFKPRSNDVPRIYKTELVGVNADGSYFLAGILPFLFYVDYPIADTKVTVDSQEKTIVDSKWRFSGGLYWVI